MLKFLSGRYMFLFIVSWVNIFSGTLKLVSESSQPNAVAASQVRIVTPDTSPTKPTSLGGDERHFEKKKSVSSGGSSLLRTFKEKLSKGKQVFRHTRVP